MLIYGCVWFCAKASHAKILEAHNLMLVCFVAKNLVANEYLPIPLTDSCQIFVQVWAQELLAIKSASQILPRLVGWVGHEPNIAYTHVSNG